RPVEPNGRRSTVGAALSTASGGMMPPTGGEQVNHFATKDRNIVGLARLHQFVLLEIVGHESRDLQSPQRFVGQPRQSHPRELLDALISGARARICKLPEANTLDAKLGWAEYVPGLLKIFLSGQPDPRLRSIFRQSRLAHAVENALDLGQKPPVVA